MQTGTPQFMFVDEFQDTDDVQIDALKRIAELLQYKLFVVGDIKQCIYRFPWRKRKKPLISFISKRAKDQWLEFFSDQKFSEQMQGCWTCFDKSFSAWGAAEWETKIRYLFTTRRKID